MSDLGVLSLSPPLPLSPGWLPLLLVFTLPSGRRAKAQTQSVGPIPQFSIFVGGYD